jgi:hypothetical protein
MKQHTNRLVSPALGTDPFPPRVTLRRAALLKLAFLVNSLADCPATPKLSFADVHAAARQGRLLDVLSQDSGCRADFSFLQSPDGSFDLLNSALRDASTLLNGREFLMVGLSSNGYCLVLALVLYALQERLPQIWPEQEYLRPDSTKSE